MFQASTGPYKSQWGKRSIVYLSIYVWVGEDLLSSERRRNISFLDIKHVSITSI